MPIIWSRELSILERFPDDIIIVIADQLAETDLWGSISSLCQVSNELKRVVSPYLVEKKKRIWMRLDDWNWDEIDEDQKDKYGRIGIIEFNAQSRLPVNLQHPTYVKKPASRTSTEQRFIRNHCRPWMLIFKGYPHRCAIAVYERFFPAIKLLKFVFDSGTFQAGDIEAIARIKGPPESTVAVNKIATLLMEKRLVEEASWADEKKNIPQLRYHRIDSHGGIQLPGTGRIASTVKATARAGFEYNRQEWSYYGDDDDLSEAEAYCLYQLAMPQEPRQMFTSIKIDVHIGSATIPDLLFFTSRTTIPPPGYNIFADLTETIAQRHLSPTDESTLEFRLFYRHGSPFASENDPIFWSTYAMTPYEHGRLRTVKRCVDEDFARCRMKPGCKRCIGQRSGVVEVD